MSTTATDATRTTTNSGTDADNGGTGGVTGRVREKAGSAYSAARDRTSNAYGSARDTARTAGQRTSERIDTNPVAALIGGLALGGLVAWFLPKSERETQALGSVGGKITDTARQAAQTAIDAGKQQVNEIKDNAATKVGQAVIDAVSTATTSNQQ